jgi:hypothetical protein
MSDRFIEHADRALDPKRETQDRFGYFRNAAEAFCKLKAHEPFKGKVAKDLSRMIAHLRSKKVIDDKEANYLENIRIHANPQMHDNESKPSDDETEQALEFCIASLKVLKSRYCVYPSRYTDRFALEVEAKIGWKYLESIDDRTLPFICFNGDEPHICDQLQGFLGRFHLMANYMHNAERLHGTPNVWLVFGRKQWTERTLRAVDSPSELKDNEIDGESPSDESQNRALKFECAHIQETGVFEITEFKLSPPDPSQWNIVVMGQEACLQYLFEQNLSVTQEDVFNQPMHSKHPAVSKYKNL